MAERPKYQFKSVQLLKDQSLGIGSDGAVCKAKCDDLLCAAKIIHPTLFDPTALQQIAPQREHRLPIRRFEQEHNVTTSSVLLKSSTQLYSIRLHYSKLPLKESTDCPLDALSRSVSS